MHPEGQRTESRNCSLRKSALQTAHDLVHMSFLLRAPRSAPLALLPGSGLFLTSVIGRSSIIGSYIQSAERLTSISERSSNFVRGQGRQHRFHPSGGVIAWILSSTSS